MTSTTDETVSRFATSRRGFLATAAGGGAAFGFSIVPRHALWGAGYVAGIGSGANIDSCSTDAQLQVIL